MFIAFSDKTEVKAIENGKQPNGTVKRDEKDPKVRIHHTRKSICKNKDADQLCSNCTADQRLCICFTDSMVNLLLKS